MHSNEQELHFQSLQEKKIIIPEKAFLKRQHTKVNPIAFFLKEPSKKPDLKVEVGQDLNDWDSGKQTDLFENEKS